MAKNKPFVLTDESVNTYGFRVLLSGGDLDQFLRNPVLYFNHDDWDAPIGMWENTTISDDRILSWPVFDLEDESGKKIAGKVERGFLKMASIGIIVNEWSDDPAYMLPGQTGPTAVKWRLREASIVGIGSNHNAIRLYDKDDNLLSDDQIIKLFDNSVGGNPPQIKTTMKKELLDILKLSDKATEDDVFASVKKLQDEKTQMDSDLANLAKEKKELSDKISKMEEAEKTAKKKEAEQLVDKAIRDGKLNAAAKEETLKFFDANFDAAKKMIEGIPGNPSIKDQLEDADKSELQKLSDKSWDELDKSGQLQKLKDKYPEVYMEKFNSTFKKE
jgi:hypothetical protein